MKTTRRGFSRKVVMFGIAVFTAIALTATGFAAWLISNDAQNQQAGNITGDSVQEASIKITIDLAQTEKLMFAANKEDVTGLVRHDGNENVYEDLDISSLKGTVSGIDKMGNLAISLRVPDAVLYAAGYTWTVVDGSRVYGFDKTKAFVSLPDYATDSKGNPIPKIENGELSAEKYTAPIDFVRPTGSEYQDATSTVDANFSIKVNNNNTITFTAPMKMGWGLAFNGINPGYYYDTLDAETNAIPEDCTNVITTTLNIMNAILYSVDLDSVEMTVENSNPDLVETWAIDFNGTAVAAKDFVLPTSANGVIDNAGSLENVVIKKTVGGITEEWKPIVEGSEDVVDYEAFAKQFNQILSSYMNSTFMSNVINQPQYVVFVAATVNK